jgi:hypothetical protein
MDSIKSDADTLDLLSEGFKLAHSQDGLPKIIQDVLSLLTVLADGCGTTHLETDVQVVHVSIVSI